MGWGEEHEPENGGTGTTGQIEQANLALDKMGVRPGPLALRVLEIAERVCERCGRASSRWEYVDDVVICGGCIDEHARALDAAVAACAAAFPATVISTDEFRDIAAVAVKAYIECPGDA